MKLTDLNIKKINLNEVDKTYPGQEEFVSTILTNSQGNK